MRERYWKFWINLPMLRVLPIQLWTRTVPRVLGCGTAASQPHACHPGLDANGISPMWFSKLPEGSARSRVLNMLCDAFTSKTPYARNDIDGTLANDAAPAWATYDWRVDEWGLTDHNIINVVVTRDPANIG